MDENITTKNHQNIGKPQELIIRNIIKSINFIKAKEMIKHYSSASNSSNPSMKSLKIDVEITLFASKISLFEFILS